MQRTVKPMRKLPTSETRKRFSAIVMLSCQQIRDCAMCTSRSYCVGSISLRIMIRVDVPRGVPPPLARDPKRTTTPRAAGQHGLDALRGADAAPQ